MVLQLLLQPHFNLAPEGQAASLPNPRFARILQRLCQQLELSAPPKSGLVQPLQHIAFNLVVQGAKFLCHWCWFGLHPLDRNISIFKLMPLQDRIGELWRWAIFLDLLDHRCGKITHPMEKQLCMRLERHFPSRLDRQVSNEGVGNQSPV